MELLDGERIIARHRGTGSVLAGFLEQDSFEYVPLLSAAAWPAGPPDRHTVEGLLTRLGEALDRAGTLDAVLLNLHGAMVAEEHPDVELDVVSALRETLGGVPIACVLDLHGIPSPRFIELVEIVIAYDTYPHVDMFERGREASSLLASVINGGPPLRSKIAKLPHLTTPLAQVTGEEPMRDLLAQADEQAEARGLARVSLLPGFPYSDVERAGFSVIAVGPTRSEGSYASARTSLPLWSREFPSASSSRGRTRHKP